MLLPGPIISGFKIPGVARLDPREEYAATTGASLSPIIVQWNIILAVGSDVELMY